MSSTGEKELCWDTDNGLSLIGCQKPKGHTGDRHGYSNISGMSAAWSYVDEHPDEG